MNTLFTYLIIKNTENTTAFNVVVLGLMTIGSGAAQDPTIIKLAAAVPIAL